MSSVDGDGVDLIRDSWRGTEAAQRSGVATWDDVTRWLEAGFPSHDVGAFWRVLVARSAGTPTPVAVFPPTEGGTLRLAVLVGPVSGCSDHAAAARLTSFEHRGKYYLSGSVELESASERGIALALRRLVASAIDVRRRLRRRSVQIESSCFSAYAD